jgi:hypothetical protein
MTPHHAAPDDVLGHLPYATSTGTFRAVPHADMPARCGTVDARAIEPTPEELALDRKLALAKTPASRTQRESG